MVYYVAPGNVFPVLVPPYNLSSNRVQPIPSGSHPHLPWQEDERFERNSVVCKKNLYRFNVGLIVVGGFPNTTHKI